MAFNSMVSGSFLNYRVQKNISSFMCLFLLIVIQFLSSLHFVSFEFFYSANISWVRIFALFITVIFLFVFYFIFGVNLGFWRMSYNASAWLVFFSFCLFYFSIVVSSLMNGDFLFGFLLVFFHVFFLFLVVPVFFSDALGSAIKSMFWVSLFFIVLSLFVAPPEELILQRGYSGIFNNPNHLGLYSGQLILSAALLMFYYKGHSSVYSLLLFGGFFVGVCFLFMSQSRTFFVAVLMSFVFVLPIFYKRIKQVILRNYFRIFAFFICFVPVLFISYFLFFNLLSKQTRSLDRDDLFQGRFGFWAEAFSNLTLFGHDRVELIGFSAHSSYLAILNAYGLISFVLFCFFIMSTLFFSFFLVFYRRDEFSGVPVLMFVVFFAVSSFGETLFGFFGSPMLLTFIIIVGAYFVGFRNTKGFIL